MLLFCPLKLSMLSMKAAGPDGFTALFFKKAWNIIVDEMKAIHAIEACCSDQVELLNDATMILLPKNPAAAHPQEFRPISLINFFAKLVMKILATRLGPHMHELINPCQSAFIKSRSIHENFIYVQSQVKQFRLMDKSPYCGLVWGCITVLVSLWLHFLGQHLRLAFDIFLAG
jgi:hypothetical protein